MKEFEVDIFLSVNGRQFPNQSLLTVRNFLLSADENKQFMLKFFNLKDPTISLILSLFFGALGIDRFYVGDIGLGILKLITFGGLGIWTFIDWFLIMGTTREKNLKALLRTIN